MLLATKPTKDHFCSLLISNIYWLTSLSTDSAIEVHAPGDLVFKSHAGKRMGGEAGDNFWFHARESICAFSIGLFYVPISQS